ncbi:MAG TPA: hypothetical protein VLJ76_08645 [Gaiellaceae bacterium]|nr:hypothetical protein [Gaiellaceae bacterium]
MKLDAPIPPGAEERAHRVAMTAFAERRPAPRKRSYWRPVLVVAVVAGAAGVLASPPGRSVIHAIREAVGIKKAQRQLFSLPAPGRLLVNSANGPWVVQQDGTKRLLGQYIEASWSPFGRFVVARRGDELVTMEPDGKVHWTLSRPAARLPAWGGQHANTRIAFLSDRRLHVVAGDGTGDAARCAQGVTAQPAWQPGSLTNLAIAAFGRVAVEDVTTCKPLFVRSQSATSLQWSSDGKLLLAVSVSGATVYDLHGHVVARTSPSAGATFVGATHQVAALGRNGDVRIGGKVLFHAAGLRQIVSSPDGRWLLVTWPAANQWVFVRVAAPHTIRAYSTITGQFGKGSFPEVAGWIGK